MSYELRKYVDIIQEGEYIPFTNQSVKTGDAPYELYRALLQLPEPSYEIKQGLGLQGLVVFYSKQEYEYFKKKMERIGLDTSIIEYHEEGETQADNITSPVPSPGFRLMKN